MGKAVAGRGDIIPMTKQKEYAVYKGENFLCMGTAKECATHLGVKPETIHFYHSPAYRRRVAKSSKTNYKTVVCLDDDE